MHRKNKECLALNRGSLSIDFHEVFGCLLCVNKICNPFGFGHVRGKKILIISLTLFPVL